MIDLTILRLLYVLLVGRLLQRETDAVTHLIAENRTLRGLVTYYTVFVLNLASRRVHILGSTRYPDSRFMQQVARRLVFADEGLLTHHRILLCDRDTKWSLAVRQLLTDAGLQVVQTPYRAPNANAHDRGLFRGRHV